MDINKKFIELYEEYEKEWHEGHEPQGGHDHYEDIGDVEELEEARTYLDREDERKKKKSGKVPQSQKKSRWGSGGYGKGEEAEIDEFYAIFAVRHRAKDGKRYVIPFKTQQKADKKAKELKSAGATEIEVSKEILKGNIKWKEGFAEDYDKNQLLRVQHDEKLIAETGDICSLDRGDLRSKSMQKVYDKKCSPEMIKKKKSIFGKIAKGLDLYNQNSIGEETMKTEKLVDTVRKVLVGEGEGDQAEYQKKRKAVAKKFGVESCSALKDEAKRKECYNALDKAHVADHEEQVELAKMKKEGVGDLSDKELKTKMKGASTQKETDAACGEMGKRRLKMEKKKVTESAALQLKMAFDDAKIKIKGVKGGKLVIAKKDKKKAEDVISKQMKKPADAKRILGTQIVFEEPEKAISKLFSHVIKLMSK